ncbi:MAG: ClbS/DfsB family four-helix bundle protein [Candidatus Dojkabacteria bacterium]
MLLKLPRARTKKELIEFGNLEKEKLLENIDTIKELGIEDEYVFGNRKPKDIVAHLVAWQKLMDTWYTEGMEGLDPEIPAPGYTFKTAPKLNEKLFQEYKNVPLEKILAELEKTHSKMIKYIDKHSDKEHFTKKKYKWTGSTSMGTYFASAVSSHYAWANELLKKLIKVNS